MNAKPIKINIDQIAEMFGLSTFDSLDESNREFVWDAGDYAAKEAHQETEDEQEIEAARYKAEEAAQAAIFHAWHAAVMEASEAEFTEHGLSLVPLKVKGKTVDHPYEFKIVPVKSWTDAANLIRETVNGVGYYHFSTLGEMLRSGPYTARALVASHLGYVKRRAEVYGDIGASHRYDRAIEYGFRNL